MHKIMGILLLLVFICAASTLLSDRFALPYNMLNILRHSAFYGIFGIGVSLVIITGGIDLSIGSMIGLAGCLLPIFLIDWHWPAPLALAAVMGVCGGLGLAHGLLITQLGLQPFIVTLCGLLLYRGIARWITGDQTQGFGSDWDDSLRLLATGRPCTVATLILAGGLVMLPVAAWRNWHERRLAGATEDRLVSPRVLAVMGLVLALVGSSRFWSGADFNHSGSLASWSVTVPDGLAQRPQEIMAWAWPAALGCLGWLLAVTLPRQPGKMLPPLGLSLLGVGLVLAAQRLPAVELSARRMTAVMLSLGCLIAGIGWLCQRSLAVGGAAAKSPLALASFFAVLWLLGQTPLGETQAPAPLLFLLALAALAGVFLNQTIYGRYLFALGRNEEAARYSGINTGRMIVLAYILCGLASGLGGILFALDNNSIQPSSFGEVLELYAIAAAVLGGCSLRGGEGSVLGVIFGAAVMRVLYNSINILGIPSHLEFVIIGTVILCGVLADELVRRLASRRKPETESAI